MTDQTLKDIDRAFKALEERDELLNNIRVEIEKISIAPFATAYTAKSEALKIIDKYKAESESQKGENNGN